MIPALSKALEDSDPAVRVAALDALTSLGDAAVPTLSKALEKPALRYWAALRSANWAIKPSRRSRHNRRLKDDQPVTRREVLVALARIGPDAADGRAGDHSATWTTKTKRSRMPRPLPWVAWARRLPAPPTHCVKARSRPNEELMRTVSTWALAHVEPDNAAVRRDAIARLT